MVKLEYLAGFFDGEGCIGAYRMSNGGVRVRCAVANTVKESVDIFQSVYGGKVRERKYKNHPNWKTLWVWEVNFRDAGVFLKKVLPFLRIKRMQAERALHLLSLIPVRSPVRKDKYPHKTSKDRIEAAKNVIEREGLIDQMHLANLRGLDRSSVSGRFDSIGN